MALSLGNKKTDESQAEERLRARLADLEGRLEDGQKIRQLENHIKNLKERHEVELQKARLEAKQEADEVKAKAKKMVKQAKKRIKREKARYQRLTGDLEHLEAAVEATAGQAETLSERGLEMRLVNRRPSRGVDEDPREFLAELVRHQRDLKDRLSRIEQALGDGSLDTAATDLDLIEHRSKELLSNPELKSKAMTVAEKARMFAQDPGKSQYYKELIHPYAEAIQQVCQAEARANVVYGCQEALTILEECFRDSRTYLLRRSGKLDDHSLEVDVGLERLDQPAEDAIGRMRSILESARALGPVDFFQNLEQEVARRVERDEKGAKVAAWILSDATVTVLEDETVRSWLESQ